MAIEIEWTLIKDEDDEAWDWTNVLYAYTDPEDNEILYIGKAYGPSTSVLTRFRARDKNSLWKFLDKELEITEVNVLIGNIALEEGFRLTKQLIADIEGLLIYREDPCGNVQSTRSRGISRSGMRVKCTGDWPSQRLYIDR